MTERVPAAKGISDSTLRRMMPFWMDNLYENLPKIRGGKDIVDIPKRENEPCIIVGAGPSLKYYEHLKIIAESGWKHPVISCDKVLSECIEAGVIPYASASVDASSKIANFYAHKNIKKYASTIYGIFNSFTSPSVVNTWINYGGRPYWFVPELDLPLTAEGKFNPGLSWMLSCITKHPGVISAIGNVGSFCWNFAGAVLNCSPVILVGFDFSEQIKDKVDAVYFNQYVGMFLQKFDEKKAHDKAADSHQLEDNPDVIAEKTGKGWLQNYYEVGKPVHYLINPIWKEYRNKFALSLAQSGIETINCIPQGIGIITLQGIQNIENCQKGDKVLAHTGEYREITETYQRKYEGKIIRILSLGGNELLVTPEHPILVVRGKYDSQQRNSKGYARLFPKNTEWIKAEEIQKSDFLVIPVVQQINNADAIVYSKHGSTKCQKIPIDEQITRLIGYYLAEGCIGYFKKTMPARIIWVFGKNKEEEEYVKDVKSILEEKFKLHVNVTTVETGVRITICNASLARFLTQFGVSANTKNLPSWVLTLPHSQQESLFQGYWRGDGSLHISHFRVTSASKLLLQQTQLMLLRLGIVSALTKTVRKKASVIRGRKLPANQVSFSLAIGGYTLARASEVLGVTHPFLGTRKQTLRRIFVDEKLAYYPVQEVCQTSHFVGDVYNIAVKDAESFVIPSFGAVHNCTGNGCLHTGAKDDKGNYILKLPNFKVKTLQEVIKEWK